MRDKLKGAVLGALVAAFTTVLLAQTPPWTAPITWTTGDLLTASQFNAQFRDNLLNLRAFSACSETGISGTASADTVLFGDCRWDSIPATTVVALDMGDTTTTATAYQTIGPTATLTATTGQSVRIYLSGRIRSVGGAPPMTCGFRGLNTSTNTELFLMERRGGSETLSGNSFIDSSPSTNTVNTYALQLRSSSVGISCQWRRDPALLSAPFTGAGAQQRGFIAVVT